jgi:hypothetical protein
VHARTLGVLTPPPPPVNSLRLRISSLGKCDKLFFLILLLPVLLFAQGEKHATADSLETAISNLTKIVDDLSEKQNLDKYMEHIGKYKITGDPLPFGFFLYSLRGIKKYCKNTNKKEQLGILEETWRKSNDIFGEIEVLKAINLYEDNPHNFKT